MKTIEERFWAKVEKTETCWNWTGALSWNGYGRFHVGPKADAVMRAHRWSYTQKNGEIAGNLHLDHTCANRKCVNPAHLREVTPKQNAENRNRLQASNTTGVKGVHWLKRLQKYRAGVRHNGQMHWAGVFRTLEEAEAAVIAKRNELFTHNDMDRSAA